MNYTTREIADITHSELIGDNNAVVKNIAFDSRIIYSTMDTAFLAINTEKKSGEKYIQSAIDKNTSSVTKYSVNEQNTPYKVSESID